MHTNTYLVQRLSFLLNFFGIVGIAGTIVSVLGLLSCKERNEKGRHAAILGIVIGGFSIIYGVISILQLA